MDARVQLFDLKSQYGFQTTPNKNMYNMPLYGVGIYPLQTELGSQTISPYPVYQGFESPVFVNGIQIPFYTQREAFFKIWLPFLTAVRSSGQGDGTTGPYSLPVPYAPAIPGHVDISGIIQSNSLLDPIVGTALNTNVPLTSLWSAINVIATDVDEGTQVVTDSGQFLSSDYNVGFLQTNNGTTIQEAGQVNYATGDITATFAKAIKDGSPIQVQCYYYNNGIPRAVLFYNNVLTLLPPPDTSYYVELTGYLSPAAFMNQTDRLKFGYMSEYMARGAARKILSDTGDVEQFNFYEPLFREQESLVWKRSQRQFTAVRTGTIFSDLQSQTVSNSLGQGST